MNILLDGTWNTKKDNTNVYRLYEKYGGKYFPGPGTKAFFLDRMLGGAFGKGTEALAEEAYAYYDDNYVKGEVVNMFMFSRGAAAGRKAADMIAQDGGTVNFLGAFDTVGALGVPLWFWPFEKYDDLFMNTEVHPNVLRVAHATALNEPRKTFKTTLMTPRDGIVERGFEGDHNYIGSSDETFNWMVEQFEVSRVSS